ncbi:unnamed protein product [Clonostachys byssicola]|uniref:CHAT domain-containing protein n=1 Tax=Clonostachys byssicola TaxID=160290 RepID=A0A9N9UHJ4_9HYPO|nr:unnamed protein product [Clonostachys byssicola]
MPIFQNDDDNRALLLNDIGWYKGIRYENTKDMADLEEAIRILKESFSLISPDHPLSAFPANNLEDQFYNRYVRLRGQAQLEELIQATREALDRTPKDHKNQASLRGNLGAYLLYRYYESESISDLEEGIRYLKEAVLIPIDDNPDKAVVPHMLGVELRTRFDTLGDVQDLEDAIRYGRQAVEMAPANDPRRVEYSVRVASYLEAKFATVGDTSSLQEAFSITRKGMETEVSNHNDRVDILDTFATLVAYKFSRVGGPVEELEEGISAAREAVNMTPSEDVHPGNTIRSLLLLLNIRYLMLGEVADLEENIEITRRAINSTPENDPVRVDHMQDLQRSLMRLYEAQGSKDDLDASIQVARQGVEVVPEDHPGRAKIFYTFGMALSMRHTIDGDMHDLKEAIDAFQMALRQSNAPAFDRIRAGRLIMYNSPYPPQAYRAALLTISMIPKLIQRTPDTADKLHILASVVGAASEAAAAALEAGIEPRFALGLLEQGRHVLQSSPGETMTGIIDLREEDPELERKYFELLNALDKPIDADHVFKEMETDDDAFNKYYDFLANMRKIPGLENLFVWSDDKSVRSVAKRGPIVVINVTYYRCDAFIVTEHETRCLNLGGITGEDIEDRAEEGNLASTEVLEWLWDEIAQPVLNDLGFTESPSDDESWPRIWWIPTGLLSRFPLHAAGYHTDFSGRTVLDRVVSSYASSIKSILHHKQGPGPLPASPRALLVAMENTPEHGNLRFTTQEIEAVNQVCQSMNIDIIESGRQKQDLVQHLPKCSIFHFAGHGSTDGNDPSNSRLLLDDWRKDPLKVADLLDMKLHELSPFLAYLSACGTGRVKHEGFVDEGVHLMSAFQLAGFRHVIGTLWEVNDEDCVHMARITYEGIRNGGMTDESVSMGLHRASRTLRDQWLRPSVSGQSSNRALSRPDGTLGFELDVTGGMAHGRTRDTQQQRDILLVGDEDLGFSHWAPYVHFGG